MIYETETEYQYARVVEYDDGERKLELNEGQAIHSTYRPGSGLTGNYWDGLLVDPFAALERKPERVAMLGTAAGTTARAYARFLPDTTIDAVEIDGELLDIGRRYFDLEDRPQLNTIAEDARPFLRRTDPRYDVIMVDAYRQPYIPFYLTTKEFFELARERLAPGGVVAINVGHPEGSDRLERVLSARRCARVPRGRARPAEPDQHDPDGLGRADHRRPAARRLARARPRAAPGRGPRRRAGAARAERRHGLHRRPRAGRVARRRVDVDDQFELAHLDHWQVRGLGRHGNFI